MGSGRTQISITRFFKTTQRLEAFVSDEAYNALNEIGQRGVKIARDIIANQNNATDFSLDAQTSGLNIGPGRNRTGRMSDSVNYRETSIGSGEKGSRLSIEFGYFNAPMANKGGVPYAVYQEKGFWNYWLWRRPLEKNRPFYDRTGDGHWTEGIFAIRDAAMIMRTVIRPKVATAAAKKIARRMNGA